MKAGSACETATRANRAREPLYRSVRAKHVGEGVVLRVAVAPPPGAPALEEALEENLKLDVPHVACVVLDEPVAGGEKGHLR